MKPLLGLLMTLTLAAAPTGGEAQDSETAAKSERGAADSEQPAQTEASRLERWHPEAFPEGTGSEDPADSARVTRVAPAGSTKYVERARKGVIASSVLLVGGGALTAGMWVWSQNPEGGFPETGAIVGASIGATIGLSAGIAGAVGLGISAKRLRDAKQQLTLFRAGEATSTKPPGKLDGYSLADLELRTRRAKLGLIAPAGVLIVGIAPLTLGMKGSCENQYGIVDNDRCRRLRTAGLVLMISGAVGLIIEGLVVAARKRQERERRATPFYSTARSGFYWDLSRSAFVF
jgi:hypothetical protein